MAKLIAPEIEVRDARRTGIFRISSDTAAAEAGPSINRHGTAIR